MAGLDGLDLCRQVGGHADRVPRLDLLPLRVDLVGAVEAAAGEVLEDVVAVETAPLLPYLATHCQTCGAGAFTVMARVVLENTGRPLALVPPGSGRPLVAARAPALQPRPDQEGVDAGERPGSRR